MSSLNKWAVVALVVLALGAGSGVGGVGVTDVEGQVRVYIRPGITGIIKGGPVGGPYSNGPFFAKEAQPFSFIACCVVDPTGGTVTLEWDFDYDGSDFVTRATGAGPVTYNYGDGPGDYVVALRLSSPSGGVSMVSADVSIVNQPPVASVGGPYTARATVPIQFSGSATDPSDVDQNAGFTYEWDYEYSGTFAADQSGFNLTSPSHAYTSIGNYTVALRVIDKDGGASTLSTAPVTVLSRTAALVLNPAADAGTDEGAKNANFGASQTMDVRSLTGSERRSLVRFDLSGMPANSTLVSARLKLYATVVPSVTRSYDARRVTESWAESSVTWQSSPDVVANYTARASTPAGPDWMVWDVTSDVQSFLNGVVGNYGWMVIDTTGGSSPAFLGTFATRECPTTGLRPVLEITYEPQ
ncbi:MAG: DNRLRE domain-containing protein [Chloroflexi bacterium]|nr:DNRLRE domain-containing protein [Chloroflexota bacterium]